LSGDEPLMTARGVTRRYRRLTVLQDADLDLKQGEAVALVGPNGAGKTTLLSILAGVSAPSAGTVEWRGQARARVGWVPQRPALYQRLTPRENLRLFCALEGAADPAALAERLLERADLTRFADRSAAALSTGTMQRLNIAIALAGEPVALLLDEPSATLDPEQRHRLWSWLEELREADGLAVLFSTQLVEEAARHAPRLLVLARGRVVFDGTVDALVAAHGNGGAPTAEAAEAAFLNLVGGAP
jgi:ABC-type multidrug transport system ATPase subunit